MRKPCLIAEALFDLFDLPIAIAHGNLPFDCLNLLTMTDNDDEDYVPVLADGSELDNFVVAVLQHGQLFCCYCFC